MFAMTCSLVDCSRYRKFKASHLEFYNVPFYNEVHAPFECLGTIWYLFLVRTLHATMCATVSQYANAKVYGQSAAFLRQDI